MTGFDTDVLVIGGGPAGLAAAIAVRHKGFQVLVSDSARPPIDKACGEGLMPDNLDALRRLGVALKPAAPFRGIRFVDGPISLQASFRNGCGLGVRRMVLHREMVQAAEELGITFEWGARITGLFPHGAWMRGRPLTARWIIGADGANSGVCYWAGLSRSCGLFGTRRRFGFRRHYRIAPWSEYVEVHWSRQAQLYITPVAHDEICVALISSDPHFRFDRLWDEFPHAAARLHGAPHEDRERGSITLSRQLPCVAGDHVALIGDASGSVDAITGEGLSLAFHQSLALAEALAREDLRSYETAHRHLMRRPMLMSELLLLFDRHPRLRCCAFGLAANTSKLFETLLAMHVGAVPAANYAFNFAGAGWQFLAECFE